MPVSVEVAAKAKATHLGRAAYLYVRQSTIRQVLNNTESTLRQYDLRQRAVALGWSAEQIIVVDVDQGHSGASAADREGFQRLVADVSMGRAGIVLGLPVGLVYDPTGKVVLDPDSGVQQAVRHLFATFARTGSARAVVQNFRTEGLRFPGRIRTGPHKGELSWTPLRHDRVLRVLHNPRYAGAFVYGRLRQRPGPNGRLRVERLPREQWTALIPDSHPGYITWETFELNQKLLADNARAHGADRAAGPAREGNALLQGLAVCGRCGCRMSVAYHLRGGVEVPDYRCMRAAIRDGVTPCTSISGAAIDAAIGKLLLDTVTPLALEVALTVQAELETRADEADALRKTHVERARHRAETARRRYLAVDPDNRLVADTLEADWNDALRQLRDAQDDYEHASAAARAAFTEEHKNRIRALAADFPALWSDPSTPQRERKRMARLLIEDVTINKTDHIDLHVRFKGGQTVRRDQGAPRRLPRRGRAR
jgi:DNA invertase Pin-like site-specific DNA recombinase